MDLALIESDRWRGFWINLACEIIFLDRDVGGRSNEMLG